MSDKIYMKEWFPIIWLIINWEDDLPWIGSPLQLIYLISQLNNIVHIDFKSAKLAD